jgi:hypothetical protein
VRTDRAAGELAPISGDAINDVVKRCVELIGLDPDGYGGHSLRAGMINAAAADGVPDTAIMARSGHKSVQTLKRYIRRCWSRSTSTHSELQKSGERTKTMLSHSSSARSRALTQFAPQPMGSISKKHDTPSRVSRRYSSRTNSLSLLL